jgi:heptosyltransferase-1
VTSAPLLVLRLSALGDVIHTLPAVIALRRSFPDRRIGWVVEAPYRDLVRLVAPVDEVFVTRTRAWRGDLRRMRRELPALRRDLRAFVERGEAIDFQGLVKSSIFAFTSGASTRFGFAADAIREKPALLFTNRHVHVDTSRHVIEWNLQLAAAAGGSAAEVPTIDFGRFALDPEGKLASLLDPAPVVILPATGQARKEWPPDRFAAVARALRQRGMSCVVAWGPGEEPLAKSIAESAGVTLAPPTTLGELAHLLQHSRLVIAGDTGPLHLAAAMERDCIALFGPTDARRNGPWGQLARVVEPCAGEMRMDRITVEMVMSKVAEVLG